MPSRIAQETRDATARVLAGESIRAVSRDMRVGPATIRRHLKRLGAVRGATGWTLPAPDAPVNADVNAL